MNNLFSQSNIKHFTQESGVLSNTVYSGFSDSKGYMWFSTDQGVTRYDGYEFVNYTIDEGLTDNEVFKMFEDSKKRIWFLTYNGKPCYYQNDSLHNPSNTSFLNNFDNKHFFTQTIEDENGKLWFFTEYGTKYYTLEDESVKMIELPEKTFYLNTFKLNYQLYYISNTRVNNNLWKYTIANLNHPEKIISTFEDKNQCNNFYLHQGTLFFGSNGENNVSKVNVYKVEDLNFNKKTRVVNDSVGAGDKIYHITGINGKIYIGTNTGVIILNSKGKITNRLLENVFITSISQDYEKGVWCTTKNDGIFYIPNTATHFYKEIKDPVSIIRKNPFHKNTYYFAAQNILYIVTDDEIEKLELPLKFGEKEQTTDIAFLNSNTLLIGNGNGLTHYDGKGFKNVPGKAGIKQIILDGDSILFARSTDIMKQHLNQLFDPLNIFNQPFRSVYSGRSLCMIKLSEKEFLIGDNFGAHILFSNGTKKSIDSITHRIKKIISSNNKYIAFCSDVNGLYLKKKNQILHYTINNGLVSNRVNSAVFDKNNNLWVATAKGLSYIEIETKKIQNFGTLNGIVDEKINDIVVINDTSLLLATSTGVYNYNPLTNMDVSVPKMEIRYIKVNTTQLSALNLKSFNHDENNIEIHLSGISYNNKNLEFYYRIKNQHDEWTRINGRLLTFVNLPPGEYTIELKCKNSYQKWSTTKELNIHIRSPFYSSWWFIILIAAIGISISGYLLNVYQKRKNKEKEIQLILSETKQKALRAQLNPHFVFNALNSIQYLYISNKEDAAIEYLNKFSVLLRNTLNHSDKLNVSINEELENIRLYLEIEQLRTENVFTYEYHIDENVDAFSLLIPSMLIQPFVENSVWHGFKGITRKGKISIHISSLNRSLIIKISDNGKGFNSESRANEGSKGMKLIRERIDAMNSVNDEKIELHVLSTSEGTTVKLTFPIKY